MQISCIVVPVAYMGQSFMPNEYVTLYTRVILVLADHLQRDTSLHLCSIVHITACMVIVSMTNYCVCAESRRETMQLDKE